MKNKIAILLLSLIMVISLGFAFANKTYAKPCPINSPCANSSVSKQDCCQNCKKHCKNCTDCKNCSKQCLKECVKCKHCKKHNKN